MREYETVFIVQPEISDEGRQAILSRLDGVLARLGAVRLELDDWGKRKLAYEIRKFQKGHYMVLHYAHDGAVVPEIERSLRLDESVLRFLTAQVSDEIADLEQRKKDAAERERLQRQRAAERAARESEERARAAARAEERRAEAGEDESDAGDDEDEDGDETRSEDEDSDEDESREDEGAWRGGRGRRRAARRKPEGDA